MKKLITLILFASLTFALNAQGLLKTVPLFPTKVENEKRVSLGEVPITHKILFRLDATMAVKEVNINKVTKESIVTDVSFIGPAVGFQSYIPTSATDGTPVNNYGASLGIALGRTIYQPNLAEFKTVLAINIWQYFRFGGTYTLNPPTDIRHLGYFVGGGITF